ncbi:hypothetical protein ERW49_19035 [Aliivibrio finisterrensis]|uniref:Uncharacterized protein n=1 Tax=Aliivibrio finisterrensis TaxID=511998 RepID=A0A4V1Z604_9GAMM|nr:hypothetical protein ERW49_19035 [Aliivibrio finisterrensis]
MCRYRCSWFKSYCQERRCITNASTRFATFGILDFFEFTVLSGKFKLNLHDSKRVMQALYAILYSGYH